MNLCSLEQEAQDKVTIKDLDKLIARAKKVRESVSDERELKTIDRFMTWASNKKKRIALKR